jgi:hypothetical protein
VRALLQELADLAAEAEGGERREVPLLADRALGDQLAVLVRDAVDAGTDAADVHARLVALRRSW